MTEMTEAEREALRGLGQGQVPAVVEAILAARLAAIEALADEWEAGASAIEWAAGGADNDVIEVALKLRRDAALRLRVALAPAAGDDAGVGS